MSDRRTAPFPDIYAAEELPESEQGGQCQRWKGDPPERCENEITHVFVYGKSANEDDDRRDNCLCCESCCPNINVLIADGGESVSQIQQWPYWSLLLGAKPGTILSINNGERTPSMVVDNVSEQVPAVNLSEEIAGQRFFKIHPAFDRDAEEIVVSEIEPDGTMREQDTIETIQILGISSDYEPIEHPADPEIRNDGGEIIPLNEELSHYRVGVVDIYVHDWAEGTDVYKSAGRTHRLGDAAEHDGPAIVEGSFYHVDHHAGGSVTMHHPFGGRMADGMAEQELDEPVTLLTEVDQLA